MHPVLIQLGPVTVMTHDAFTLLALGVGLAIYYRELRVRGWLSGPIVWISLSAVLGGALGGYAAPAGPEQRARARALVIAIYAVTFLVFAVFFLSKPSALQYGWGILLMILGVTLCLALLLSMWTIGRSSPRAATVGGAVASMVVLPVVLLLVVTGLCVVTTVPVGLLN